MLHVPQRTPSQLAAIEHQKKFRHDIAAKAKVIPIVQLCQPEPVPVVKLSEDDIAFGPIVCRQAHGLTVEKIIIKVAEFYDISRTDLVSERRTANLVRPRQVAMYLSRMLTPRALTTVAKKIGGRDHTTVIHAVRKIEAARLSDAELEAQLQELSVTLCEMPLRPAFKPQEAQQDATAQPAAD